MKFIIALDKWKFDFFKHILRQISLVNSKLNIFLESTSTHFIFYSNPEEHIFGEPNLDFLIAIPISEFLNQQKKNTIDNKGRPIVICFSKADFQAFANQITRQTAENAFLTLIRSKNNEIRLKFVNKYEHNESLFETQTPIQIVEATEKPAEKTLVC